MAPENNNKEVTVDTNALRASAILFDQWGDELLKSLPDLKRFKILPGEFPAATELKTIVDTHTTSLTTNTTNLGNALKDISLKLEVIAADYDKTEDDNLGDAERLDAMFNSVNDILNTEPAK
ncbi:MAG TPA: hypothetical protein VGR06_11915 [Actinophytocola sp.]|jgi:hypothetical protein|uniref:hypothetical protein n=1 Tax=Actinophytocola sp. TaxID=1872138 RepID=UPI002DFB42F1|nr:hypothetical protein [Actinophytocola sp.]